MNISDLIIIYLAFGAPIAVYKYLHSRAGSRASRILTSLVTLLFWTPEAVRMGYRHFSNAYSDDGFVSGGLSDSADREIADVRRMLESEIVSAGNRLTVHDVRETLDRYVGLTLANSGDPKAEARVMSNFFSAAGRRSSDLGEACLIRRNQSRLKRHQTQASRDFLSFFDGTDRGHARRAHALGLELAERLGDVATRNVLLDLAGKRSEVWNPLEENFSMSTTRSIPALQTTAALNND